MRYMLSGRSAKVAGFALTPVVMTMFLARAGDGDAQTAGAQAKAFGAGASGTLALSSAAMPAVTFALPPVETADGAAPELAVPDQLAALQPVSAAPAPIAADVQSQALDEPASQAAPAARHPPTFAEAFTAFAAPAALSAAPAEPLTASPAAPMQAAAAPAQPVVGTAQVPVEAARPAKPAAQFAVKAPAPQPPAPQAAAVELAAAPATPPTMSAPQSPTVLPQTKLALADWSYSLPAQSAPAGASSFADSARGAPSGASTAAPAGKQRAGKARPAQLARSSAKAPSAAGKLQNYRMIGSTIEFQLPVQADGQALGQLTVHVVPDQPVALHLKELVSLFSSQLDPQLLQALNASSQIDEYVTFERLRQAGIDIRYDAARNRITLAANNP